MPSVLMTAPEAEPIDLADAKAFLRLEHDAEDALVARLIAAAAAQVERLARRVLVAQRWRMETAPPRAGLGLALRPRPVREVEAVRLRRPDGTLVVVDAADWSFDWAAETLTLLRRPVGPGTLEIDLAAGYGAPADVPESLRLAVRRLTADAFERRTGAEGPPADVRALVAPYRDCRL